MLPSLMVSEETALALGEAATLHFREICGIEGRRGFCSGLLKCSSLHDYLYLDSFLILALVGSCIL